jgi:hypothetical protein
MAYREATPQETKDWLGSGLVMPGRKPPRSSEKNSTQQMPQVEPDQMAHDQRMAEQTPQEREQMIKGLGDLARSKVPSAPGSLTRAQPDAPAQPTTQVDPAKGNALLRNLFGTGLPMVPDPTPQEQTRKS